MFLAPDAAGGAGAPTPGPQRGPDPGRVEGRGADPAAPARASDDRPLAAGSPVARRADEPPSEAWEDLALGAVWLG